MTDITPLLTTEDIVDLFEGTGHSVRSYSGRAMHGERCLGVECTEPTKLLLSVVRRFCDVNPTPPRDSIVELIDKLHNFEYDSMGNNWIVYFPWIPWEDDAEDDEDDD